MIDKGDIPSIQYKKSLRGAKSNTVTRNGSCSSLYSLDMERMGSAVSNSSSIVA
jgi:hypothetical protein